jgi:hypothetical protein
LQFLAELGELVQRLSPSAVAVSLEGEHVAYTDAPMLAGSVARNLAFIEETHDVLSGDVQELGGLLSRQFLADWHDADGLAAAQELGDPLESVEHGRRERDALTARTDESTRRRASVSFLRQLVQETRKLHDLLALVWRSRNGCHAADLFLDFVDLGLGHLRVLTRMAVRFSARTV